MSKLSSEPDTPKTPPPPEPTVRVTLPTPSSFSSRRSRAQSSDSGSPEKDVEKAKEVKGHARSVSFSLDPDNATNDGEAKYRIPQRKDGETTPVSLNTPMWSARRAPIPQPLNLSNKPITPSAHSPFSRIPATAPHSRLTHSAASKGLSIAPALSRGARHSISNAGSIWSATLGPKTLGSGWISPALNSARSTGTATRQRGLTVAVLKDGKEMVVGDVPLTPGLSTGVPKSAGLLASTQIKEVTQGDKANGTLSPLSPGMKDKRDVVILCRYYHTPGLTCTSRPCRFVHNLDTLKSPKPISEYEMLSPGVKDPTGGTFARAQLESKSTIFNVEELVTKGVTPGETVVLANDNGSEITGTVYLMSGGGKGPAGKSRAKFKTVPCKDYAEGFCQYGDYCSFIHDEKIPEQKLDTEDASEKESRRKSTGSVVPEPGLKAWTKALPRSVLVPAVNVDASAVSKQEKRLSAFAPPYSTSPMRVDEKGDLVALNQEEKPEEETATSHTLFKPKAPLKKTASSTKALPPLKKVSIIEPERRLESPSHLTVPLSGISLFGTESDPATPWDPAMQRYVEEEQPRPEYGQAVFTPPSPYGSSPEHLAPWTTPSYPWGMPMSPSTPLDKADPLASIPGGPGVMWTPAGWAVQDAAMKISLKAAEVHVKSGGQTKSKAKSYYKTRPCKFFAEGNCPHGDDCSYLHEESSKVREKVKPANAKTLPCKFYNSAGGCNNGDDCDFLHQLVVPSSVPLIEKPRPWRTRPCRHWQVGRCTLGEACHFAHVLDPTRKSLDADTACRHWASGRCDKGDECKFKHEGRQPWKEQHLTEASLAKAYEAMRRQRVAEESDGEEDNVEIVTNMSTMSMSSLAPSVRA